MTTLAGALRRAGPKRATINRPSIDIVQRAGLKHERAIAYGFETAVDVLFRGADVAAIRYGLLNRKPESILNAFPWDRWRTTLEAETHAEIVAAFNDGAMAAERQEWVVLKQAGALQGAFDMKLPRAEQYALLKAAKLVTNIDWQTRAAMRDIIVRAFRYNLSIREQVKEMEALLRLGAGLDRVRARALENYERRLREKGMGGDILARRVQNLRDRYLHDRAVTIARNETLDAANAGQEETWRQAVVDGRIPATMEQVWIAAEGDRTCPICRSLNRQRRPLGQHFISPYNEKSYARPPAHPVCRCSRGLVEPKEKR